MSWSVRAVGTKEVVLEKFTGQAQSAWGYTHSIFDKEALDWVIEATKSRVEWYTSNGVLGQIFELESTGHFDDGSGQGNVSVNVRVLRDRRQS